MTFLFCFVFYSLGRITVSNRNVACFFLVKCYFRYLHNNWKKSWSVAASNRYCHLQKKISFWLAAEEATPTHYFLFSCIHIHLVSCIHWSIVHYVTQENEGSVGPCWINSHTNYGPMLHFFKIWGTLWLFNCAYIFILFMWFESSLIPFDR